MGGFLANIDSALADTLANCSVMIFSGTVAPGHLMLMPAGMVFMETVCVSHSKKSGTDSIGLRLGLLYSSPQAWKGYANVKRVYDDLTPKLLATPTACLLKLIIDKHHERLVMQNTLPVMMKNSDIDGEHLTKEELKALGSLEDNLFDSLRGTTFVSMYQRLG